MKAPTLTAWLNVVTGSAETNGRVYKHSTEVDCAHYEAKNDVYEQCGG